MKHFPWVLVVLLAGCIEPTKPVSGAATLEDIDRETDARRSAIHDMNADVSMSAEGLEKSGSFSGVIVYQPPGNFRMDAIKRMGPTLFTFTMVDDAFRLHILAENKLVRGSVRGQERKHPELVAAFAWLAERREADEERKLEEEAPDHFTILTTRGGKPARRTVIERPSLFVTQITLIGDDGKETAQVRMTDYREVKTPQAKPGPSAWVPWKTVVTGRKEDGGTYTVETKMNRVYLNEGIEPGTFNMEVPEGATVEEAR